jgi:ppGpp synthetase/RelA/SpoT-type nucleotidyltranferase
MPSQDYDAEKVAFREYYNDNLPLLQDAHVFFRGFINSIILVAGDIEIDVVISRVKDREEAIRKFSRKYQKILEDAQTDYAIKDYITDLIGVRVICLYETDVNKIARILKENFLVLEETDKVKKIEATEDSFGYKGLHLDLKINEIRADFAEYRRYANLRFEVQVRTIIQNSWSVLDHKIKYKKSIPNELKRRINVLAALFELADHEFLSIRSATQELQVAANATFVGTSSLTANAQVITTATAEFSTGLQENEVRGGLDAFGFLTIVKQHYRDYVFIDAWVDGFVQEILKAKPDLTAEQFANALANHLPTIHKYRNSVDFKLNPFTEIRHALYLDNKEKFGAMLFDRQRRNFEKWCAGVPKAS